jgi:hypothetical protein
VDRTQDDKLKRERLLGSRERHRGPSLMVSSRRGFQRGVEIGAVIGRREITIVVLGAGGGHVASPHLLVELRVRLSLHCFNRTTAVRERERERDEWVRERWEEEETCGVPGDQRGRHSTRTPSSPALGPSIWRHRSKPEWG